MKKIWKLFAAVLSVCMAASLLIGCGGETARDKDIIKIAVFDGGYGLDWLETIAKNYTSYSGQAVKVDAMYIDSKSAEIKSGACAYDIVCHVDTMFDSPYAIMDLTDVYNSVPAGEEKSILEKMNPTYYDYLNVGTEEEPKFNHMIWAPGTMGLLYNETVFNEYLVDQSGNPDWELPKTTDELMSLCDRLKEEGVYAFINSNTLGTYSAALVDTWWAQYDGIEAYRNFYKGTYTDENGVQSAYDPRIADTVGRREAMRIYGEIMQLENGYIFADSDTISFTDAQAEFCGCRIGKNTKPSAMMVNGDWMENESSLFLNEYGNTIKFMNVPVVSALGDKIGVTEEQLSELVSFVDGNISSVSFTYTEDQLRAVREARSIIYNNGAQHTLVVPASTPKFEEVKDFLVYLYSNESQKIYARRLNGLTMPYGFDISTDSTIETSDVTQSLFDCYGVNPSYIFTDFSQILVYRGGLVPWRTLSNSYYANFDQALFKGYGDGIKIFEDSKTYIADNWDKWLESCGLN